MGFFDSLISGFGSSSSADSGVNSNSSTTPESGIGGWGTGQSVPADVPDPVGPSAIKLVNSFESSAMAGKPASSPLDAGTKAPVMQVKSGKPMIESYEASANQQGQSAVAPSPDPPKADVKVPAQSAGSSQANGSGSPASPTAAPQNGGQPGTQTAGNQPQMRPDLGDSVKSFESGNRGVASVSSGVNDPGGVSYGTYQLSSNSKTLTGFLSSPEGNQYAAEFSGLTPGSAEFSAKWKAIAAKDPEGLHQAEKAFIYRTHYQPVVAKAAELGFDMNNPAIQDAIWSGSIQHGKFSQILESAGASPSLKYMWADDQLKTLYSARGDYMDSLSKVPKSAGRGRYANELPAVLERNNAYQEARRR